MKVRQLSPNPTPCSSSSSVEYSALAVLQTYPQLINFDTSTYEYFVDQYNLCGYNLTLSYPSEKSYPSLRSTGKSLYHLIASLWLTCIIIGQVSADTSTTYAGSQAYKGRLSLDIGKRIGLTRMLAGLDKKDVIHEEEHVVIGGKRFKKRQSTNSTDTPPPLAPTGVLNPYYECFLMEEIWDYVVNYTLPWRKSFSFCDILFVSGFVLTLLILQGIWSSTYGMT